jgi:hypothetical protein
MKNTPAAISIAAIHWVLVTFVLSPCGNKNISRITNNPCMPLIAVT